VIVWAFGPKKESAGNTGLYITAREKALALQQLSGKPIAVTSDSSMDSYAATIGYRTTSTGEVVSLACECFVEGTLVWSETGLRPIQDLRVGDRVLTQDIETGEISFQGVIARSLRPPALTQYGSNSESPSPTPCLIVLNKFTPHPARGMVNQAVG
jgi:hypothetical protein